MPPADPSPTDDGLGLGRVLAKDEPDTLCRKGGSMHLRRRGLDDLGPAAAARRLRFYELVATGTKPLDAYWDVMTDEVLSLSRFMNKREAGGRFGDAYLRQRMLKFLAKVDPDLLSHLKAKAHGRVGVHLDDLLDQTMRCAPTRAKDRDEAAAVSAQLKGIQLAFDVIGIAQPQKGAGIRIHNSQVNVTVQAAHCETQRVTGEILRKYRTRCVHRGGSSPAADSRVGLVREGLLVPSERLCRALSTDVSSCRRRSLLASRPS